MIRALFLLLIGVPAFAGVRYEPSSLAPLLSQSDIDAIRAIVEHRRPPGTNYEQLERRYHQLVQNQVFTDLIALYSPQNASRVQVTYAGFAAEGGKPDPDLGYGLHVVKRLVTRLADGREKVIEVNEAWAENPKDGGVYAPDEIRIKTRVFDGPRRGPGSQRQFLFDVIRFAWGPGPQEVSIHRRTRYYYDEHRKKNELRQMRVPVASPFSCLACHGNQAGFTKRFLAPGEKRNYEAIVQDSVFASAPEKTPGFRDYLAHLARSGRSAARIAEIRRALLTPEPSTRLPMMVAALEQAKGSYSWLGDDYGILDRDQWEYKDRQGVYRGRDGGWYVDAIESVIEGKYRWWEPVTFLPSP